MQLKCQKLCKVCAQFRVAVRGYLPPSQDPFTTDGRRHQERRKRPWQGFPRRVPCQTRLIPRSVKSQRQQISILSSLHSYRKPVHQPGKDQKHLRAINQQQKRRRLSSRESYNALLKERHFYESMKSSRLRRILPAKRQAHEAHSPRTSRSELQAYYLQSA